MIPLDIFINFYQIISLLSHTDFTKLTKNASLHSRLPSGCNKQQAAFLYADKPAVVASDAHFASAAKPTAASVAMRPSVKSVQSV